MKFLILNGPNLNLLGTREKSIYGAESFEDYFDDLKLKFSNLSLEYFQNNVEGEIINKIHQVRFSCDGIVQLPTGDAAFTATTGRGSAECQ